MLRALERHEELKMGDQVYYGYRHCNGAKSCFMKYKEANVVEEIGVRLKTVGAGLTKYRILVKGNKNPSVRYGHQLFVKVKPKHEDTIQPL